MKIPRYNEAKQFANQEQSGIICQESFHRRIANIWFWVRITEDSCHLSRRCTELRRKKEAPYSGLVKRDWQGTTVETSFYLYRLLWLHLFHILPSSKNMFPKYSLVLPLNLENWKKKRKKEKDRDWSFKVKIIKTANGTERVE